MGIELKHIRICEMAGFVGERVRLKGWLYHARAGGRVHFLILRDGTGLTQCIYEKSEDNAETFKEIKQLGQESSLMVTGEVRQDERSVGGYELAVGEIQVVHPSEAYPITPKAHGVDFLLKHRHLHLRSQKQWALARVRHTVVEAIRDYFNGQGYTLVDTPILSATGGEGEQTLFRLDYFGQEVSLTQTGQLHLEAAAVSLGKVYCFGPTFRAEKSKTRRHLTEFWMVEPEMTYIDFEELLAVAEEFVCSIVQAVLKERQNELAILERDTGPLEKITGPFERMSYSEAVELLHSEKVRSFLESDLESKKSKALELEEQIAQWSTEQQSAKKQWTKDKLAREIQEGREDLAELRDQIDNIPKHMELAAHFEWGKDLGGSDETILSCLHDKPILLHRYPKQCKAFYMKPDEDDSRVVLNVDCLAPEGYGEIIGGSMREENYEALRGRIVEQGLDIEDYRWYLDLRRYGTVPHGGFGLGVERTVSWICGIKHVRETIAFPRMIGKMTP